MMHQKRILAGALGCLLICSQPCGYMAAAQAVQAQTAGQQAEEKHDAELEDGLVQLPEQLEPDYNDPDYVKQLWMQENMENSGQDTDVFSLRVNAKVTKSPFTGLSYTHAARLSDSNIVHGIDVSKWQADINWKKVKAAGVKYVFIRCGYTSLSDKFAMYEDPYFRQNIQGAYDAGIKVGIYFFSNSKTVKEAQKEAEKTLELIKDYKHMISFPVVYDFEAFSNAYRAYGTPKEQVTKNAFAFMETIQGAGYKPMYYGSPNFLNSSFDVSKLTDYDCWLANYTTKTSYTGDYAYWQYSSSGRVDGIAGNVDCNFYYDVSEEETPEQPEVLEDLGPVTGLEMSDHTMSSITIRWNPMEEAAGYKIYRSKSYGGVYKQLKVINENTVTEFTDATVMESEGRQYFYKVVPYIIEEKNIEDNTGNEPGTGDNTGNEPGTGDNTGNEPGAGDNAGSGTQEPGTGDNTGNEPGAGDNAGSGTQEPGTGDNAGNGVQEPGTGDSSADETEKMQETAGAVFSDGSAAAGNNAAGTGIEETGSSTGNAVGAQSEDSSDAAQAGDSSGNEAAGTQAGGTESGAAGTDSDAGAETQMGTDAKSGASDTGTGTTGSNTVETVMRYGVESKILTAYTKRQHSFRLKTSTNMNLREHAGTEYASLAVVPSGTELTYFKYTLSTLDKKWYKVTYKANGKSYTGYLSGSYVKLYTYGKTTKKVNMRPGAGLGYKVARAVAKGTKVTVLGSKWDEKGTKWNKIRYKKNGKTYTGFVPAKYLKQV